MTTPQKPIDSGFDARSTAADVIAGITLEGKTAIVTGGYSGIGVETVRALRDAGARVIVPVHDNAKAATTLHGLEVEIGRMDLLDPSSIDAFAQHFLSAGRPLAILINSAGIMASPLFRDSRGYEGQFATNHLGHFQLAARLWPALKQANGARVVALSSLGHRYSGTDFDDPNFQRRDYDRWVAYGQSKTANSLFAVALDTLGIPHDVRAFAVHPGRIMTALARYLTADDLPPAAANTSSGAAAVGAGMKTPEQGAATTVWAATNPHLEGMGGVYCENCDIARLSSDEPTAPGDTSQSSGVRPWAIDPSAAQRLWHLSEQLTGVAFDGQ